MADLPDTKRVNEWEPTLSWNQYGDLSPTEAWEARIIYDEVSPEESESRVVRACRIIVPVGGRAISEYTKTDRLSAEGLGIGLAVCVPLLECWPKMRQIIWDDEGLAPE